MTEGGMLKKITEAMKDLVTEANFDCSTTGISLQAMVRAGPKRSPVAREQSAARRALAGAARDARRPPASRLPCV